jgi:biopolymer transport protein ExbD
MQRSKAYFRRRFSSGSQEINLTPLIDTALTLLIIFMVATPMIHNSVRVDLPRGGTQQTSGAAKQDFIVYIDSEKNLYFNGAPVTSDALTATIQQALAGRKEEVVFLRGDANVAYGQVMEVFRKISPIEGVKHVSLATKRT